MRDRLQELQHRAQEFSEAANDHSNHFSEEEDGGEDSVVVGGITPQAVVFEAEPIIESFLTEAQQIRNDISALETEVKKKRKLLTFKVFLLIFLIAEKELQEQSP